MSFQQIFSQFVYRIEPKPGGGFIATCKDPAVPAIEGATRSEVEQKIRDAISSTLGSQFPALATALQENDLPLHYHVENKPGGGFLIHGGDPAHQPIEGSTREHLEGLIESRLVSSLMEKLPPELHQQIADQINSGGLDVTANRKLTFAAGGGMFKPMFSGKSTASSPSLSSRADTPWNPDLQSSSPISASANDPNQSPVTYEKSRFGSLLSFLLVLAVLALLLYFYLHRS
jgi:hypothetical protein